MAYNHSPKKLGIFGHVGNTNLGDEAIIAAVIENIRQRLPDAKIYAFTINPQDTSKRHGLIAYPIRRIENKKSHSRKSSNLNTVCDQNLYGKPKIRQRIKSLIKTKPEMYAFLVRIRDNFISLPKIPKEILFLTQSYNNLKGFDLLIIAGSQQLIDYVGGPWGFPYTLYKWTLIARMLNTKVAFLSVGAGPIRSSLGKYFARKALSAAVYRSYRDKTSKKCIQQLSVPGDLFVCPDLAFSLKVPGGNDRDSAGSQRRVVGINPVPFYDNRYWLGASKSSYRTYIQKLADFALWLIEKGYSVHIFPTQLHLDPPVICDIRLALEKSVSSYREDSIVDRPINSFNELIAAMSAMEIAVATRYHGVVLSYVLGKPVLGIAYHQKTADLMSQMGQSKYALSIHDIKLDEMKDRFIALQRERCEVTKDIKTKTQQWRKDLQIQYDKIIRLVNCGDPGEEQY